MKMHIAIIVEIVLEKYFSKIFFGIFGKVYFFQK
jgi:hypothetical protein